MPTSSPDPATHSTPESLFERDDFAKHALPDDATLLAMGLERTRNKKGFSFNKVGTSEAHWLSSLPSSPLPLLDVGACYGVHTLHALREGRDVIALDSCPAHIDVLRTRAAALHPPPPGRLTRAFAATVPAPHLVPDSAVAGILCSELIHFLRAPELRSLLRHFHAWLAPGGKAVVTAGSWPPRLDTMIHDGMTLIDARSAEDARRILHHLPIADAVDAEPGMMLLPDGMGKDVAGDFLHMFSTQELAEVARDAGFDVLETTYYSGGKYGSKKAEQEPETVLLVAQKRAE